MFHSVCNLDLDFSNWDVSKVTNFEYMFYQSEIKDVDMSNWKHSSNARMKNMFSNSEVENVIFGDISNVYNMDSIFIGCHNLKSVTMTHPINSNLSNYSMFYNVTSEGTFYYNPQYDYSKVIAELPETWTAIPLE
jgi:surface protein